MTLSPPRSDLLDDLHLRAFAGPEGPATPPRIGLEYELLPRTAEGEAVPLETMRRWLAVYGGTLGWTESRTGSGVPCFAVPGFGAITLEPGGQIELSGEPQQEVSAVLDALRALAAPLRARAAEDGIGLVGAGMDPFQDVSAVPQQLDGRRYRRMAAYLGSLGPAGARMMRQSASIQVNVDCEASGFARWRLLNAAAPYLTAIFANSSHYAGAPAAFRSYRAANWLEVDSWRTGLFPCGNDPVEEYFAFAVEAPDFLQGEGEDYLPFLSWWDSGVAGMDDWHAHLSTLFPEIRPRDGYLEIRAIDSLPLEWVGVPVVLLAGLLLHPPSAAAAGQLLGAPDRTLLLCAAREAVSGGLGETACRLFQLGLEGAAALGDAIHPVDLDHAREFFRRYTAVGRAPADDTLRPALP